MIKIPNLFKRDFASTGARLIYDEYTEGCEWAARGEGWATVKWDGSACLFRGGVLYKRYDAKQGKTPPDGFIPAQQPDAVTKHYPGWLPVSDGPEDKYHREALLAAPEWLLIDGATYELVGPKVQGNPYGLELHKLVKHGDDILDGVMVALPVPPRDFDGLKAYLGEHRIEGIVWHHPNGKMCKVRRSDFGHVWPVK